MRSAWTAWTPKRVPVKAATTRNSLSRKRLLMVGICPASVRLPVRRGVHTPPAVVEPRQNPNAKRHDQRESTPVSDSATRAKTPPSAGRVAGGGGWYRTRTRSVLVLDALRDGDRGELAGLQVVKERP